MRYVGIDDLGGPISGFNFVGPSGWPVRTRLRKSLRKKQGSMLLILQMAGVNDWGLGILGFPGDGLFFVTLHVLPSVSGISLCKKEKIIPENLRCEWRSVIKQVAPGRMIYREVG